MIARLGGQSHGVVTRRGLLGAGLSVDEINHRLGTGALLREHRSVYRVGHRAPSQRACYLAAVLACGDGALLGGRAAAHLLGLIKGRAPVPEVITPTERSVGGVVTHRARASSRRATWRRQGIPCSAVPDVLVDLAAALDADALARACHEATVRFRATPKDVESVLARRPTSPGAATLRRVLRGDVHVTLSVLEARFLVHLREAGMPLPETNRPAGGRYVDCRWPDWRLTVELDSYRYHGSRHAWELDRRREREAYARGDDFRRYTYGDVTEHPRALLTELRDLLQPKHPA